MAHRSGAALDAVSTHQSEPPLPVHVLEAPAEALQSVPAAAVDAGQPLAQRLGGNPLQLTFFAAMRKLEGIFRAAPRFGESPEPALEPVRLGQDPSLAFRGSALTEVTDAGDASPARVRVSYFGAFGPHGPFPTHWTQYIDDRRRQQGDTTWLGFLDIFHHRMLSLFYRAWANAQPTVQRDRPDSDHFAHYLGALIGQSTSARPRAPAELDELALCAATHFVGPTRHAEGLRKSLQLCFGVPVAIEEFVGQWLEIPPEYCWVVPSSQPDLESTIGVLGESTRVGTQVWDRQSKFRVILAELALEQYRRFLPGGDLLVPLIALVRRYAGDEVRWDLRLVLREADRRPTLLGSVGLLGQTANVGQSDGGAATFQDLMIDPADHFTGGA